MRNPSNLITPLVSKESVLKPFAAFSLRLTKYWFDNSNVGL